MNQFVVEIVPLSREMPFATLLYIADSSYTPGDYVNIPFQQSTIAGVVIQVRHLRDARTLLRALPYKIRDGVEMNTKHLFTKERIQKLIAMCDEMEITPRDALSLGFVDGHPIGRFDGQARANYRGIMAPMTVRARQYESLTTNSLIISPNPLYAKTLKNLLSNTHLISVEKDILSYRHNAIGITTSALAARVIRARSHIGFPITTIVFDAPLVQNFQKRAKSGKFFNQTAYQAALYYWAGLDILIGDEVLAFGDYTHIWPHDCSLPAPTTLSKYDVGNYKTVDRMEKFAFKKILIPENYGKKILIFCNQKNVSGYIICSKCGHIPTCSNCARTLTLTQITADSRIFRCKGCQTDSRALDECPVCHQYSLQLKRMGVDGYADMIRRLYPGFHITTLEQDTKSALTQVREWNTSGGILISTSAIFNHPYITPDICYITPNTWSILPSYPEEVWYQYAWMYGRSSKVIALPGILSILKTSQQGVIPLSEIAQKELETAQKLDVNLPCILAGFMVD